MKKRIGIKLLIPIVIAFAVIISTITLISKHYQQEEYQKESRVFASMAARSIQMQIDMLAENALARAFFYARNPTVTDYYEQYYRTQKRDTVAAGLREFRAQYATEEHKHFDYIPKVHFHLPPAMSLCRCWVDETGDDLSTFRKSILQVYNTKESAKGIEMGRAGIAIRGIAPITDKAGNYMGSVECFFDLTHLLKTIRLETKFEVCILQTVTNNEEVEELNATANRQKIITIGSDRFRPIDVSSTNFKSGQIPTKKSINMAAGIDFLEADDYLYSLFPIYDITGKQTAVGVCQIDISHNKNDMHRLQRNIGAVIFVLLLLSFALVWLVVKQLITKPVKQIVDELQNLVDGKVGVHLKEDRVDEIGMMKKSLNRLNHEMVQLTNFARQIGHGNFGVVYSPRSHDDVLGNTLVEMRQSLKTAKEASRLRELEEHERNWASEGIAKFAEILRGEHNNISSLCENIISQLVKYTEAAQGGMFVINDADKQNVVVELMATYAYDRQRSEQKIFALGDGLVGTCAIEAETIFLTEVPQNYINIGSGLGDASPRCVLIVPLKHNAKVFGVIEMASFKVFQKYQIDFIEKVGESIAVALNNLKISIRTAELLSQADKRGNQK